MEKGKKTTKTIVSEAKKASTTPKPSLQTKPIELNLAFIKFIGLLDKTIEQKKNQIIIESIKSLIANDIIPQISKSNSKDKAKLLKEAQSCLDSNIIDICVEYYLDPKNNSTTAFKDAFKETLLDWAGIDSLQKQGKSFLTKDGKIDKEKVVKEKWRVVGERRQQEDFEYFMNEVIPKR